MSVKLAFELEISGEKKSYEFRLRENKSYRVGREGAWLSIPEPSLSRHHFEIRVKDHALRVVDLASTNGLYVNGLKLKESPLKPGDLLQFGTCKLAIKSIRTERDDRDAVARAEPIGSPYAPVQRFEASDFARAAEREGLITGLNPFLNPGYFLKLALHQPDQLFRDADYDVPLGESLLLIVAVGILHWVIANATRVIASPVAVLAQTFLFAAVLALSGSIFAGALTYFRLRLDGVAKFGQNLALFAYAYALASPLLAAMSLSAKLRLPAIAVFTLLLYFAVLNALAHPPAKVLGPFILSWVLALIPGFILISTLL